MLRQRCKRISNLDCLGLRLETLSNIMLSLEGFRQRQANFFARMFIRQIVLPSDECKLFGRLDLSRQVGYSMRGGDGPNFFGFSACINDSSVGTRSHRQFQWRLVPCP